MRKRIMKYSLLLALVLFFTGCTKGNNPSSSVNGYLEGFKTLNSEHSMSYLTDELKSKSSDYANLSINKSMVKDANELYSDIKWKVISEDITGDIATVEVEIESPDIDKLFSEMLGNLFLNAFMGESANEGEMENQIVGSIKNAKKEGNIDYNTTNLIFTLINNPENSIWLINEIEGEIYGEPIKKEIIDESIPDDIFSDLKVEVFDRNVKENDNPFNFLGDELVLSISAINNYDKPIKGVKGRVYVKDMFGDDINDFLLEFKENIPVGEKVTKELILDSFDFGYSEIKETPFDDLTFSYVPSIILFVDGTDLELKK